MANRQEICFIEHREHFITKLVEHKNVFTYTNTPGAGIEREIQKLCFWILRKLRCFYVEPVKEIKIKRHTIRPDSFMENILTQMDSLESFWNRKPTRLLIGTEDYAKLMKSEEFSQQVTFNTQYAFCQNGRTTILGLTVHVIPWMKGILVMPD